MAVFSISKFLVLAAALTQVWAAAVDTSLVDRDVDDTATIDVDSALWARADIGSSMTYTSIAKSGNYGGGFWYQEVDATSSASVTKDAVYAAAKTSWNNAVAKATAAKKPAAAIGCALFIPSKGWILDTSLKAVGANMQSKQTCDVVTDFNHKNWANCAEMNALAIMKQKGWSVPATGAMMACYGNYGNAANAAKWVNPCTQGASDYPGCAQVLQGNAEWKKITVLPGKSA